MANTKETAIVRWGYTGIMENKMETTAVHWGYISRMENGNYGDYRVYIGVYIGIMEKLKLLFRV